VTLFYLLTKQFPFLGNTIPALQKAILSGEPDYSLIKNADIEALIKRMLVKDPKQRIEILDICMDKWVTNNDEESVNLDLSEVTDPLSEGHSLGDGEVPDLSEGHSIGDEPHFSGLNLNQDI